jgi:hypothetical protein
LSPFLSSRLQRAGNKKNRVMMNDDVLHCSVLTVLLVGSGSAPAIQLALVSESGMQNTYFGKFKIRFQRSL